MPEKPAVRPALDIAKGEVVVGRRKQNLAQPLDNFLFY
jgi:hypothetical protein